MRKLDKDDISIKNKIATRMKTLREKTGKPMATFASESDKDKQSQYRWEKKGASILTVNKFCKEVGISVYDFFNDPIFKEK
jgi:hypothetical protein